jgi:hypothetical protein
VDGKAIESGRQESRKKPKAFGAAPLLLVLFLLSCVPDSIAAIRLGDARLSN